MVKHANNFGMTTINYEIFGCKGVIDMSEEFSVNFYF